MEPHDAANSSKGPSGQLGSNEVDRRLSPNRQVIQVSVAGLRTLTSEEVTPEAVGLKAYGLLALPEPWVPPFFVVHADAVTEGTDVNGLATLCKLAIERTQLGQELIVRSNGATETMQQRGRLVSEHCAADQVSDVLRRLATEVAKLTSTHVHWLVQQSFRPVCKGHLSNERHLVYEPRDWVVEVELEGDKPGYITSMGIRKWRDGTAIPTGELRCTSEHQISLRLKAVSMLALACRRRMHFEWVWSGSRLWIVQADTADAAAGVAPTSLRPSTIPRVRLAALSLFRLATEVDLGRYGKLRNAHLYTQLGYQMPSLYILDDPHAIEDVLSGQVPDAITHDLEELTKRPLVIRTDGTEIPEDKREMLPRSDELRSLDHAKSFLVGKFRDRISAAGLQSAGLCLIAHHFIPSLASAWARAEPRKGMVRVESLWGLPEGLYWYSHDTFEVDVDTGKSAERLRFKGTFVAPDTEGRWVPMTTLAPYDWRRSVRMEAWILEIAKTTRSVAEREGFSVSVMWFIDNDRRATSHRVLPWFHSRSDLGELPKAAPRKKLTTARDYKIENRTDWQKLGALISAGRHIERVVVAPTDPDLIRDPQFAEDLAKLTARNRIVVELAGGVLSHAYYVLGRHGAQVECVDLFGADPEVREFNKLVRDKIPSSIQQRGEGVEVVELQGDALVAALKQKLVEEAYEALDSRSGDELLAELADVQEVVRAICDALGIPQSQVDEERENKRTKRGGFKRGLMLKKTSTPHTLSAEEGVLSALSLHDESGDLQPSAIQRPEEIPSSLPYRKPDLRTVGELPEKLFTFEAELSRTTERTIRHNTNFLMPLERAIVREFTLMLEFSRQRGVIRGTIRLRPEPQQLPMDLQDQLELDFKSTDEPGRHPSDS